MPGTEPWPWPPELDAVIAAPKHHTLIFENERVRVLDTRIPVGDTVPGPHPPLARRLQHRPLQPFHPP